MSTLNVCGVKFVILPSGFFNSDFKVLRGASAYHAMLIRKMLQLFTIINEVLLPFEKYSSESVRLFGERTRKGRIS